MRAPKKSESLEIRLPYEAKEAFMARCRRDGRSASETLRGFIEGQIEARSRRRGLKAGLAVLASAAVVAAAAPVLAKPLLHGADPDAAFARLDANHDGKLSLTEFRAGSDR